MIQRTDDEIKNKCGEIWKDRGFNPVDVKVNRNKNSINLTIERMYEYVEMNLKILMDLANFFGTMNINDSRYHYDGCETCDFGSSYTVELSIEPEK